MAAHRGDVPQALAALHDGFALARHASQAPFIVNRLVANATGGALLDEMDLVIQMPGAPNLYWALAELPRPFVEMRGGLDIERQMLRLRFPSLSNPDSLSSADWGRLASELRAMAKELASDSEPAQVSKQLTGATTPTAPPGAVPAEKLDMARKYLRDVLQLPSENVEGMTEAEIEVRYTVALHREWVDQVVKWFLLPTSVALPEITSRAATIKSEIRQRELYPIVSLLVPAGETLLGAQARIERRVARLQAIEALRMHAAATGKLPASLEEVKVVPVPIDPGNGRPFDYHLDGDVAVLDFVGLTPGERESLPGPTRIRLKQK